MRERDELIIERSLSDLHELYHIEAAARAGVTAAENVDVRIREVTHV